MPLNVLAIFGPTGVGKTAVAIAVADLLRERGRGPGGGLVRRDPGLPRARDAERRGDARRSARGSSTGWSASSRSTGEFSAGRFAALAHAEIDQLLAEGRRPIVVGRHRPLPARRAGRPRPAPAGSGRDARSRSRARSPSAGPRRCTVSSTPTSRRRSIRSDRKRIARALELQRAGIEPPLRTASSSGRRSFAARPRSSGLIDRPRGAGAADRRAGRRDARRRRRGGGARAPRSAGRRAPRARRSASIELLAGDVEAVKRAHRAYARRQLTWMRKMPGVELIDRTGRDDRGGRPGDRRRCWSADE